MVFPLTPGASSLSCKLASASCPLFSILADLTNVFSVLRHTDITILMFRYTVPVKVQTQQPYQVKYFLWHVNISKTKCKIFFSFSTAEDVRLVLVHPAQVLPLQDPDEDRLQDRGSVSVCRYIDNRYLQCIYLLFDVVIVLPPDDPQDPDGERMLQRLHSQRQRFLLCPHVSVSGYNI